MWLAMQTWGNDEQVFEHIGVGQPISDWPGMSTENSTYSDEIMW